jgi:hypothetical protein
LKRAVDAAFRIEAFKRREMEKKLRGWQSTSLVRKAERLWRWVRFLWVLSLSG